MGIVYLACLSCGWDRYPPQAKPPNPGTERPDGKQPYRRRAQDDESSRLLGLVLRSGVKQAAAAACLGCATRDIRRYLSGERAMPAAQAQLLRGMASRAGVEVGAEMA